MEKNKSLWGVLLCSAFSTVTLAQEEPAQGQLEEVTVTAERRAENVRNVPSSISTVSREDLAVLSTGGQDVRLLAARVPSLNVESSFGRAFPRFYIRGYGNGDFRLNASQPVSLIYDEVVQENPILKGFPIFDLDQVEVLRGPQGTLFGRNTPGGVVKFNSVRPSTDFGGYVNVSDATYNTMNLEGAVNLPLGKGWSMRFSGLYQHRDDFVSNEHTNEKDIYEGYDDRAARLQVRYDGGDTFNALISAHTRNLDGTARLFRANIIQPGTNDLVAGFDQDEVFLDGQNRQHLENTGGSLQMKWNFGALALYSITGYESLDAYSRGDIDGGYGCAFGFCGGVPFGPGFIPFYSETADGVPTLGQFTQEFRLESQATGKFKWQAGVYYFDEDYDIESFSYDSLNGGVQNQYLRSNQTNQAWAVFGSVNYAVTDAFELRAGVRYTNDEKDFHTGVPEGFTFPTPPPDAHLDDDNFSWDLSGTYAINDSVNLYARVATGFRGASVQPASAFGGQSVADPETIISYEAGVKADLMDRVASIYFNVFHYEVSDQQLTAVGGTSNAVRLLNSDKTVGQGAELDVQAYLTKNLLMTLGASYNDTEIQDGSISVGTCFACTVTDPIVNGFAVIDGNPLPQAPEVIANFTLRYGVPVGNGEIFAYTDWSYRSEVNFFLYESTEFTGKSLLEGGLRLGYDWSDGKYEAALFGRNITDEEVAVGGIDFDNLTGFLNEPRIFGVQFRARF